MIQTLHSHNRRLVIVSNRLPVAIQKDDDEWSIRAGAGGLVTALAPVVQRNKGLWIGWPGCTEDAPVEHLLDSLEQEQGYRMVSVPLSEDEVEQYYRGFSNETLWPLFHDLLGNTRFSRQTWQVYRSVNARFAETICCETQEEDFVWIHDYQLLLTGHYLRQKCPKQRAAFFLHIPFPSLDLFRRLPWKQDLLQGLLAYDLVGFQTLRDRRNFVQCVRELVPGVHIDIRRRVTRLTLGERTVVVGHFPISIDFDEFNEGARAQEVAEAAWYLHENLGKRQLMLGIDRLDYTKGIPERFLAFERALEKYPDLQRQISLLQVVVPSRTLVPDYQNLKEVLDGLAGRINARFSHQGWVPIHYVFRSLDRVQLLAHYRSCEIALISPLRDGMNLVAKEYCASSVDGNSVLILSEFAGAADQLGSGALLVNPYDIEATADAIYRAFTMPLEKRQRRMKLLRHQIRRTDVHRWVEWFMGSWPALKRSLSTDAGLV